MHIAAKYDRHRSIVAYPQRGSGDGGVLGNLKNDIIRNYGSVIMGRLKRNVMHKVRMKRKQKGGMGRLSDALFGLAVKGVGKMGRAGLAHAIKSDMAKEKIKNVATKYINRGIDDMTSDMSKKLNPFSRDILQKGSGRRRQKKTTSVRRK